MLKRKLLILGMIILLVALPQFIDNNYILQSFIMVLLFAYWATAWNIIGGFGGQFLSVMQLMLGWEHIFQVFFWPIMVYHLG